MNTGFSNLLTLKAQLLAEALRVGEEYDDMLAAIGLGVAAQFEKFCNRKFQRTVGATFVCGADRDHCFLDRYPVESITTVELKTDHTVGYEAQTSIILNSDLLIGYVFWGAKLWAPDGSLRFTFTGGYWWDTDEGESGTLPAGATALPDDLKLAWLMQCRSAWMAIDKLGVDILKTGSSSAFVTGSLSEQKLLPQVVEILTGYRRFTVT